MSGLYDGEFAGFKIASSEEIDTALREAIVAVDANVLLDPAPGAPRVLAPPATLPGQPPRRHEIGHGRPGQVGPGHL
ncbi:hypothetical protein AB0C38_35875 [Amycolatopsis sp. NPDC048633]|uniref:hypothetical protein n=1 Tax=Amycolatopsis sp. NPDC048633 TaxID=3157095 RepID=UPI0033E9F372